MKHVCGSLKFWLIAGAFAILGTTIVGLYIRQGVVVAYTEWGLVEMIVAYGNEHDRTPPATWDDLYPYVARAHHLPEPRKIDAIRRNLDLDFASLAEMAKMAKSQEGAFRSAISFRTIIRRRGANVEWIAPNVTLWNFYRAGVVGSEISIWSAEDARSTSQ